MKIKNHILVWGFSPQKLVIVTLSLFVSACVTAHEATWKTVPQSNVPYERAWSIVVNSVAQNFELEVSDAQSGYLRTGWKVTSKDILGNPIKKARVHVRVEERNPFTVKVKVEKQELDPISSDWVITGNDEKIEDEIMNELSGRLRQG